MDDVKCSDECFLSCCVRYFHMLVMDSFLSRSFAVVKTSLLGTSSAVVVVPLFSKSACGILSGVLGDVAVLSSTSSSIVSHCEDFASLQIVSASCFPYYLGEDGTHPPLSCTV